MRAKKTVIFYNPRTAGEFVKKIEAQLSSRGVASVQISVSSRDQAELKADSAVSIGGDGTALYAARKLADRGIPLLAVNAGGLGFLSSIEFPDFDNIVDDFVRGKLSVRKRIFLSATVHRKGKRVFGPLPALNDCVVTSRGARSFVANLSCGGEDVAEYFGDGVIVSTPTGSTAYNLSASGPIVEPEIDAFVVNPICSHSLTQRPLVLSTRKTIKINFSRERNKNLSMYLCLDGQQIFQVGRGDALSVEKYGKDFNFLVPAGFSYFDILKKKLNWNR